MRFPTVALAASFLVAPAAFSASFAQTAAVSEKSFDWIFFAIVGIPFIMGLASLFVPNMLDRFAREWPWESRGPGWDARQHNPAERADQTQAP
jgi:hypothetical protein